MWAPCHFVELPLYIFGLIRVKIAVTYHVSSQLEHVSKALGRPLNTSMHIQRVAESILTLNALHPP